VNETAHSHPVDVILATPRLYLRRYAPGDVEAVFAMFSDPLARRFYPSMTDAVMAERWIERNLERYARLGFGLWGLCLAESGELVGDCGLSEQRVDDGIELEIGYHLRADHRGCGLVSEAARACLDYGFQNVHRDLICSIVHPDNTASRAVAQRLHRRHRKCQRLRGERDSFYTLRADWMGPNT